MENIEKFITLNYKIEINGCFFIKKGFTCNKWILYGTNGQKYVLKELNYENNLSTERLCYITNFLFDSNLTLEILKTVTDEKYYVYFENKYYILQKYFEHISFDAISVEESLLWKIGELLCKCHIQLQKIELEPFSYYSIDFSADQIDKALKSEKNKEIYKILVKKKALIEKMDLKNLQRKYFNINQKFIHGDYYFDNILFDNSNFKLIDLDRSCLFFQPYEIFKGALFCSYSKKNSDIDNFTNIKSFIGGYFNTDKSNINDCIEFIDIYEYILSSDLYGYNSSKSNLVEYFLYRFNILLWFHENKQKIINILKEMRDEY
ncbi:hypothetical protein FQS07_13835 [Listeria innocua]|nr:hypothetical protein [Listeria innocua]EHF3642138.1 hypothetical protein [Listeria innocua]EKE9636822.1 hypothetical protein [Listeria innocua]EKE9671790.1 hypothetical protein [Listeria innocua]HCJ4424151.1 hypothetical protein [Listeria innocua]